MLDLDFEMQPSLNFTITVDDGELQNTATVTVNVTDANDAPTVAAISDLVLAENNAALWLKISGLTDGGDAGAEPLAISATSSNLYPAYEVVSSRRDPPGSDLCEISENIIVKIKASTRWGQK